jgi:CheY-like chemotaxis protein
MAGILGRLLIIDDQRDFACLVGAIAERLGFTTRILSHTLDLEYVMQHWHPDVIAVHMTMPDQQEIEALTAQARPPPCRNAVRSASAGPE